MTAGQLARRLLGRRGFSRVAGWYRALFVDVGKVVDSLPALPDDVEVLDVGGGDGAVLDVLLARYPRARATMIDLAPRIGGALRPEHAPRVTLRPGTGVRAYRETMARAPNLILVSDVLHHVPVDGRLQLFLDLRDLLGSRPATIIVKDLEPGHWRARLGYLADRYVSGDRSVTPAPQSAVRSLLAQAFPRAAIHATNLLERDRPNYALVCEVGAA
jgi:O-methyltransferase domain